jgi:hypothetical protein
MFNNINLSDRVIKILLLFFVVFQFLIWYFYTQNIKIEFTITPVPPSKIERKILAAGDDQLIYRMYAFHLQNAGDTFGETVPLKDYDYEKLEKWFYALSDLDWKSEYVPSIAGFYYSQSQNAKDNRYIVSYLEDFADKDPNNNWRWYSHAAYLANHKLHDYNRAVSISEKIIKLPGKIPAWARSMAIFTSKKGDDPCRTILLANDLLTNPEAFNEVVNDEILNTKGGEHNFMVKIIKKQIEDIVRQPGLLSDCLKKRKDEQND